MIVKINGHTIEVFDSTQNLPILRFQKFNKYLMIASEVGNTFADYDQRTAKALAFLQKEMVKEAIMELNNRRQLVFNAFNEFSPRGKAFACLVKSIDGKEYPGISPDELDQVLEHLDRIGLGYLDSLDKMEEAKKKIELELQVYFPRYFPKGGDLNHTVLRIKRMKKILAGVMEDKLEEYHEEIDRLERNILQQDKPNQWNVHIEDNMERALEVDFQKFAVAVQELTGIKITETTVFTFYAAVEHLKEKHKKQK